MAASSLRATLVGAVDGLLSIHSTPTAHDAALRHVERVVASVSLDPANALFDAFLRFQDDCCLNVTAVLVEWLARTLATQATALAGDIDEQCRPNLVRCLRLFQGLLLLHRPSQRFFARRSSLECLLAVLDLTRPSLPPSPLPSSPQPFPSPVLFPPTPLSSPSLGQASSHTPPNSAANTQLALAALDALLCALVDRPKNLRVFEDIGGLTIIVKVLKDKSVAQPVRIKVIELLYFYLLPEVNPEEISGPALNASFSSATASASSTLDSRVLAESNTLPALFASAADFVPQTPVRTRTRPPEASASSAPFSPTGRSGHSSTSSRESSPTRTPRLLRHKRSQSLTSLRTLATTSDPAPSPFSRSVAASPRQPLASSSSSRLELPSRSPRAPRPRASLSASGKDSNSTPRAPRLTRPERPPLSPSLPSAAPSPRASHRRSQSLMGSAGLSGAPQLPSAAETPRRPRTSKESSGAAADAASMPPPPAPLPRAGLTRSRPSTGLERRASVGPAGLGRSTSAGSRARVDEGRGTSSSSGSSAVASGSAGSASSYTSPSSSSSAARAHKVPPTPARERHTRTEGEKKELLRRLMPNVDALEQRFRAMGLGLG